MFCGATAFRQRTSAVITAVLPSPRGRDACTFLSGVKEKYQKKHAKKGYANREGYALIYLDIARIFFFPKHTIRLYFNSRLRRSKKAVC